MRSRLSTGLASCDVRMSNSLSCHWSRQSPSYTRFGTIFLSVSREGRRGGVKRTCRLRCEMSAYDPKRTLMLQNHLSECSLSVCSFSTIRCPILTVRDDDEAARVHHASQLRGGDLAARCPRAAA